MRHRMERQLLLRGPAAKREGIAFVTTTRAAAAALPPELGPRDYLLLLLHVGAEIEHSLMVQYLYAAYSLGGPHVPDADRRRVRGWQETFLGIAKEEMGHLLTIQNVLRLLGGALNLDRQDFPWDSEFFPFPFTLEKLTRDSLAKYVYVESPEHWSGPEADEIRARALGGAGGPVHRVGVLYARVLELLANPSLIRDEDFRGETYPFQASWDEWGRGYRGGLRGNVTETALTGTPDVIVRALASRDDAAAAITDVAQQGEAPDIGDANASLSHFTRFLRIYRDLAATPALDPARPVPTNPYVDATLNPGPRPGTAITGPEAAVWAHLFNLRYRMLLGYLAHSFSTGAGLPGAPEPSPRGLLIHAAFGEMYNLRAVAGFLVQTPLSPGNTSLVAGPTFQMPYSLALPEDTDTWRAHRDLLENASRLLDDLGRLVSHPDRKSYLDALRATDERTLTAIECILGDRRGARIWR